MFIRKLLATAVIAIAATGISMATAHGEAQLAGPVGFTAALAADHSSAVITLDSGTFVLAPDGVQVIAANGAVVDVIPTTLRMETGQTFAVTPTLTSDTSLTLTPVGGPAPEATSAQDLPFVYTVHSDGGAIVAGAVIGCLIGIVIGIWFFLVGAIVGCAVGAAIGAFIGAVA
ncbi:hypothetical protein [Nocardia crassostreae]|uniref:hypothetical protein n=1 Tax=Nocardia crassostreae TaxID=53428 RepID=UPI0008353256|nr:hypothetical protein [Nocardia crassostreae]